MDGHNKESRHIHGGDVQRQNYRAVAEAKWSKLLLELCQGVLKTPLDPVVLLVDLQQRDGLVVILAVNPVCSLKLIPVIKKHSSFEVHRDIQCFSTFLLSVLNVNVRYTGKRYCQLNPITREVVNQINLKIPCNSSKFFHLKQNISEPCHPSVYLLFSTHTHTHLVPKQSPAPFSRAE